MTTRRRSIHRGRMKALEGMVDWCRIRSGATAPVFDEDTGKYTSTPGAVVYEGICKRQSNRRSETEAQSGDHQTVESQSELHLPVLAPKVLEGALVEMLSCPNDPNNVGVILRVTGPAGKTWATAQRLNTVEVVG